VQVFSGALVAGVLTKATAINVTANTKVTGIVVTLLGGTFAPTYVALAANMVVGAPGTGTVVIRALKVDGTAEILNTATVNVTLRG
jgi:predicted signal transduction protein with EAL and GGDEF domain